MKVDCHKWIFALFSSFVLVVTGITVTKMNGFKQILDQVTEQQATYFLIGISIVFLFYSKRIYPKKEKKNE